MTTREVDLGSGGRLSAQAATNIMRVAMKHTATVLISIGSKTVNAKSMMGMVSLGEMRGTVRLSADGRGEEAAVNGVAEAIQAAFGK